MSREFWRTLSDIEAVVWMAAKDLIDCFSFLSAPDIHEADSSDLDRVGEAIAAAARRGLELT